MNPPGPRWEVGQSGNPSGRRRRPERVPIAQQFLEEFRQLLDAPLPGSSENVTYSTAFVRKLFAEASLNPKLALKLLEFLATLESRCGSSREADEEELSDEERDILEAALVRSREAREADGEDGDV